MTTTEPQPLTAEEAFIEAINAPSATGWGIAVPHYRDGERIWAAVKPFLDAARAVPALDAEHEDHLRARLAKMDETYHDRWPRWTDRDYYAVRALLNGAATLQATGQEPKP